MIKTETVTINEKQLVHTWSDRGVYIYGGSPNNNYDEAYDPIDSGRTYVETDIPIDKDDATAEELLNILTGEE